MSSERRVRIGCASAFWGDTRTAAPQLVRKGDIDYLVFDYLAEVTMSILAGAKMKDPSKGFATDFVTILSPLLEEIKGKGIRVLSNAGGLNPLGLKEALEKEAGGRVDLKIAVVVGDDLMEALDDVRALNPVDAEKGIPLPDRVVSLNAYIGAPALVRALETGADIVITGRCVDSALVLAPLVHEFGWKWDDFDRLAAGSIAGHILECGAQATGGNFTDWHLVPGYEDMGFPIAECAPDGSFTVTKPPGTGGLVSPGTVAEQLLYEVDDPAAYILPDVVCDLTEVSIEQLGENRVRVSGVRGAPPPPAYKVSATYADGFRGEVAVVLAGLEAEEKARRVGRAVLEKVERILQEGGLPPFTATRVDLLGTESIYGPRRKSSPTREVVLRIAVKHGRREAVEIFSREIAQAATGMAPGMTKILGGLPRPSHSICHFSFLLPKEMVSLRVLVEGEEIPVSLPSVSGEVRRRERASVRPDGEEAAEQGETVTVPLVRLAWARSGDKGDRANVAVISRRPEYYPFIKRALSEEAVFSYFSHLVGGPVRRYEVPGIYALNFVMENALGGGGMASLRVDPQGKSYGQLILDFPVSVPRSVLEE